MSLRSSFFWSFSQQAGTMLLRFANMVIIARLLTPGEVGVFIMALAIVTIIQSLREMGLANYLIREPVLQDASIRTMFGMSILLCLGIALALAALRGSLEAWLNMPGLAEVLLPLAFVIAIFAIEQPTLALVRRDMRFFALHNVTIFSKLAGVATSISLALAGFSTMSLVWGLAVESVLRAGLLAFIERRPLRLGIGLENWRAMLGFGTWITGGTLAARAQVEINKLLVGGMFGAAPAALYDRALMVPNIAASAVSMPIGRVVMSSFAADLRRGEHIGPKVAQLIAVTTALLWPLFVVMMVLSEEVVLFVLGPQWTEVAGFLPWLLLQQLIQMALLQPENVLVPSGRVRLFFYLRLVHLVLAVVSGWVALQWGLWAFVTTRPPVMLLTVILTWMAIAPVVALQKGTLARIYLHAALVSGVVVAPVALWKYAGLGAGSIPALLAALCLAAALGLIMLYALKHPVMREIQRLGQVLITRAQRSRTPPVS